MILLERVKKSFSQIHAVKNVNFEVKPESIVALLGANGSGKTTTLRMLTGLIERDGGTILVDGIDPQENPVGARSRMSVLPDQFGLYERLTPREHLHYFGAIYNNTPSTIAKRTGALISLLEMDEIADRRTAGFSHGQRMKVGLGCCLINQPKILILDEPTRGLDIFSIRLLRKVLLDIRSKGACILFSCHVMEEVEAIADEIVIVSHGRTVGSGTKEHLLQKTQTSQLEEAFVALANSS